MPQCQFMFSAVFVFQKSCTGNILRIERDKFPVPCNYERKTMPENDRRGFSQVARPHPGAASPRPAPGWRRGPPWPPRLQFFAYLFSYSGKPKGDEKYSTKSSVAAVIYEPISGGFWSSPRHPAGGRNHR